MTAQEARRRRRVVLIAGVMVLGLVSSGCTARIPSDRGEWSSGVAVALTDLRTDARLAEQPELAWESGPGRLRTTVVIDPTRRYQSLDGVGLSVTESSALVLTERLRPEDRERLMTDVFSPAEGLGLSLVRQPLGASDFARSAYSFDDQPAGRTDDDLSDFSIDRDRRAVIPRLLDAKRLNPELSVLATPWSPPGWMKDSGSMLTGALMPQHEDAYARYLVRALEAYRDAGVPIDRLTVQNEPLIAPPDYPGAELLPDRAGAFVVRHLRPALERAGLGATAVLGYDHNWDVSDYPEALYADPEVRRQLAGTAWHCYYGTAAAQTVVHNAYPQMPAYATECSGGTWQGDDVEAFGRTMDLVVGVPRNWGQSVVLWNLALDERRGPRLGGCATCRGLVTVRDDGSVIRNPDFWALGHLSRFVPPGSVRVASSQPDGLRTVAFTTPDGASVLLAANRSREATEVDVRVGGRHVTTPLPAGAAVTLRWRAPVVTPAGAPVDVGWTDLHLGPGPAGTPTGRLVQTVDPALLRSWRRVRVGDRWLAYALPYAAEVRATEATPRVATAGWRASVAGVRPVSGAPVAALLDDNRRTRWTTGAPQRRGQSLTADLGRPTTFAEIELDAAGSLRDYLRGYRVEVSDNARSWTEVARGPGRAGVMTVPLPATTARYVRVTATEDAVTPWSLHELVLRAPAAPPSAVDPGPDVRTASADLADGTSVWGFANTGDQEAEIGWPIPGLGFRYRLPPGAAGGFAVLSDP